MSNITVKLVKSWLKRLPENKWRKTYNVDARRVAHFAKLGEEAELPTSLTSKTTNGYIREKNLAKQFKKYLKTELKEIKLRRIITKIIKEEIKNVSK